MDIDSLPQDWNAELPVAEELNRLYEFIRAKKTLRISEDGILLFPLLLSEKIIEKDNIVITGAIGYRIQKLDIFIPGAYKMLAEELDYRAEQDWAALSDFIDRLEPLLTGEGGKHGLKQFIDGVIRHVIALANANGQLEDFCLELKQQTKDWWQFCSCLIDILFSVKLTKESLWICLNHLLHEIGNQYNDQVHLTKSLSIAIRQYSISFTLEAEYLLNKVIDRCNELQYKNVAISLLSTLYEMGKRTFQELTTMFQHGNNRDVAAVVIANSVSFTNDGARDILNIIDRADDFSKTELLQIPNVLKGILDTDCLNGQIYSQAIDLFSRFVFNEDSDIVRTALHSIIYCKRFDDELGDLMIEWIKRDSSENVEFGLVESFFFNHSSIPAFFRCVKMLADKLVLHFPDHKLQTAIQTVREVNSEDFDRDLISLLCNNIGRYRWAGHQLLHDLQFSDKQYRFQYNLLSLAIRNQYLLIRSILGPSALIREPNEIVGLLVPLLDTSYTDVREFLISRLESYSNDYLEDVLVELRRQLGNRANKQEEVCVRLALHIEARIASLREKQKLKEFDPYYTQSSLNRSYLRAYSKFSSRNMAEGMKKSGSILNFIKPTKVARGGGWKKAQMNDIQKLREISLSRRLPRSMFITPERNDYDFKISFLEDWANLFP